MKKILFVAMLCASTALVAVTAGVAAVTSAPASTPSVGGAAPSSGGGNFGGPGGQGGGHEHFEEKKAEIERRIEEHIAKAQERLACVRAASNHEALKACLPERGAGGRGGFGGHGGGHEGGHGGEGEAEPAPNSQ